MPKQPLTYANANTAVRALDLLDLIYFDNEKEAIAFVRYVIQHQDDIKAEMSEESDDDEETEGEDDEEDDLKKG